MERVRLYKFLVKLIVDKCNTRKYQTKVCHDITQNLEIKLKTSDYCMKKMDFDPTRTVYDWTPGGNQKSSTKC